MRGRRQERTHAAEAGAVAVRTMCGRDLNPSAGSCGSHSARPRLSGMPSCKACRLALRRAAEGGAK